MKISMFKKSEKQVLLVLTWACFIQILKEIGAAGKKPYILKVFINYFQSLYFWWQNAWYHANFERS